MPDELRKRRLADFQSRAQFAPAAVYHHREQNWAYIPIHPFADETGELSRLQLTPADCFSVDAWWSVSGDAALIQASVTGRGWSLDPGLYVCQTDDDLRWVDLAAIVDGVTITRATFEIAMSRFVSLGFPDGDLFTLLTTDRFVQIGNLNVT